MKCSGWKTDIIVTSKVSPSPIRLSLTSGHWLTGLARWIQTNINFYIDVPALSNCLTLTGGPSRREEQS